MSLLSQFFPSDFTQGEFDFLLVAGGGAGGSGPGPTPNSGGRGGGGGVIQGFINLTPGPHPVVIGGGGSPSSFSNSKYIAHAGGAGGSSPGPGVGAPGGSGGGGLGTPGGPAVGGSSIYTNDIYELLYYRRGNFGTLGVVGTGGDGGGAGGGGSVGFFSEIEGPAGKTYSQGGPSPAAANTGNGAPIAPSTGGSGIFILSYPTVIGAATTFSGATDISPSTPGKRTYRFTSTGSITLP